MTHDGTAICPSGGGGEKERTLSHCEAGAEVWERSMLGWEGTHTLTFFLQHLEVGGLTERWSAG